MKVFLLVMLSTLIISCKPDPPEYDRCVLIVDTNTAYCFPRNQPGKSEYVIQLDTMTGYQCVSADHTANIFKYVEEVEESCDD